MDFKPDELFDAVLLDAPCSSTGTVRRHPDVPWTKTPQDIAKLAELQGKLFGARSHAGETRRRDRLSNCSLHPARKARKCAQGAGKSAAGTGSQSRSRIVPALKGW